jgi:hypothetical protein
MTPAARGRNVDRVGLNMKISGLFSLRRAARTAARSAAYVDALGLRRE